MNCLHHTRRLYRKCVLYEHIIKYLRHRFALLNMAERQAFSYFNMPTKSRLIAVYIMESHKIFRMSSLANAEMGRRSMNINELWTFSILAYGEMRNPNNSCLGNTLPWKRNLFVIRTDLTFLFSLNFLLNDILKRFCFWLSNVNEPSAYKIFFLKYSKTET